MKNMIFRIKYLKIYMSDNKTAEVSESSLHKLLGKPVNWARMLWGTVFILQWLGLNIPLWILYVMKQLQTVEK